MTTRKHTPRARIAQAAQLLQGHAQLLQERGETAYIVHRHELGRRQHNFLDAVRRLLKGCGTARWYVSPWPRGAARNVLVVSLTPGVDGGAAWS
jgi:hypothetical protein